MSDELQTEKGIQNASAFCVRVSSQHDYEGYSTRAETCDTKTKNEQDCPLA